MTEVGWWYRAGVEERRKWLLRDLRKLMARYAVLEGTGHPVKHDQGKLIELDKKLISILDKELAG